MRVLLEDAPIHGGNKTSEPLDFQELVRPPRGPSQQPAFFRHGNSKEAEIYLVSWDCIFSFFIFFVMEIQKKQSFNPVS